MQHLDPVQDPLQAEVELVVGIAVRAVRVRPDAGVVQWLAVAGMLLLWVLALSWVAVCFGLIARTGRPAEPA